jgi:hypothetical protein
MTKNRPWRVMREEGSGRPCRTLLRCRRPRRAGLRYFETLALARSRSSWAILPRFALHSERPHGRNVQKIE